MLRRFVGALPWMDDRVTPEQPPAQTVEPTAPRTTRLLHVLVLALTALAVAPLWLAPDGLLPLVDNGSHLHLITILHHHDHNALFQQHYLRVHAIVPYLGYYKLVDWLAYVGDWLAPQGAALSWSIEWANRIVLSLCLAAVPQASLSLLRATGHSRWLVLAIMPWLLHSDFWMGFVSFLLSIPLFLWTLAAHLRLLQKQSWLRAAAVAGLLCSLSVTHYLLWAVALALLPLLSVRMASRVEPRSKPWKREQYLRTIWWPLRDVLLGLPSIAVLLPWFLRYFVFADGVMTSDQQAATTKGPLLERLARVYGGEHLAPVDNLRQISEHLFNIAEPQVESGRWSAHPGEVATVLWLAGMALWVFGAAHQRHVGTRTAEQKLGSSYAGWTILWMVLIYLVFPVHLVRPILLFGVNFRLIEVLAILGVIALPLQPLAPPQAVRGRVWLGTGLLVTAAIVVPLLAGQTVLMTQTEYGHIRAAYNAIPPGKRVLTLRSKRQSAHIRFHIYNGIGEYYGVLRHGYVPYSFADTSSKPMVVDKKTALPAPPWDSHDQFNWQAHGRYYDYIALYDEIGAGPPPWRDDLPETLVPVFGRGHWHVLWNPAPDPWPTPTPAEWRIRGQEWASRLDAELRVLGVLQLMHLPAPQTPEQRLLLPWLSALPFLAPSTALQLPGWPRVVPDYFSTSGATEPIWQPPRPQPAAAAGQRPLLQPARRWRDFEGPPLPFAFPDDDAPRMPRARSTD
jgi:hypothetical protein